MSFIYTLDEKHLTTMARSFFLSRMFGEFVVVM